MFLKNRHIISKIKGSKVTDCAALSTYISVNETQFVAFYAPVLKKKITLWHCDVCLSVRPSVRPSVNNDQDIFMILVGNVY